ncbi:hypothetical protein K466DRAFT_644400 [Polyporus arcularius HHB13444]|uniref:BZIP domain-containing protein n=2 Tax=Polyporaceae TaxID=5317 RepID=A0A5C3PML2_9APHY|nr:hypothetical protein K466DRAFT_644400 [Polyporus arcularius HHB13444]
MLMTSPVPSNNDWTVSSSPSLRNMPYMTQKWQACSEEASPSAASGSAPSPSLSPYAAFGPSAKQYGNDPTVENPPLISPPSPSRLLPQLAGLPADAHQLNPTPTPALYSHQYRQQHIYRQNVLPPPLSASSTRDPHPDQSPSHGSLHYPHLENISSHYPTQNVAVNSPSNRPRTSHPVFHSTSALAAHHGIPQSLPPVPRTTKFASASSSAPAPAPPVASSSTSDFDFASLCNNYLTMLSQKSEETQSAPERAAPMHDAAADADTVQAIMEVIQASPEFRMANDFSEFLTSPMEDSPFEDFLTTPALDSADMSADMLTSPAIFDADAFPDLGGASLFADGLGLSGAGELTKPPSAAFPPFPPPPFNFDDMYTMPSPTTPSLDPTSLHPSPHTNTVPTPSTPGRRSRKSLPTGTRKNITPDALVPMDAPIQQRKYVTPSATSRKEVPTAWLKKKRARSQAFGEEDELEEDINLAPGDMDAIEAKRRQNTLAARRSRKRKLEYQRELEMAVEREKDEKEMWRQRAMLFKALLESHGHEVPSLDSA